MARQVLALAFALGVFTTGCAGGSDHAATVTQPGPATPTPTPSQTTPGVVYLRSDTIAYHADAAPAITLPGALTSLAGISATTGPNGQFSLQTSVAATFDNVPLSVSLTSYIPAAYPWLLAESGQFVSVGLYPERTVTPRPGFLKGHTLMDEGGWLPADFNSGKLAPTLDRMKSAGSATIVQYIDQMFVTQFDVATNAVAIGPDRWGMGTRAMYETAVAQAHARGLQFMMEIGIYSQLQVYLTTSGSIDPKNTAFWNAFFSAWRPLVLERAAIARDLGVEWISLGHQLDFLTKTDVANWRALITDIRALGYTGKITYFSGMNLFQKTTVWNGSTTDPAFPALFDALGVEFNAVVAKATPSDVPSKAQTRTKMRTEITALLGTLTSLPKPIFVLLQTASVFGAVSTDEYIEPATGVNNSLNSLAPSRTRDYQQQADAYQAMAEVINASPVGNGRVMGLFSWGYHWLDDPIWGGGHGDAAYDKSANVRGKPAESVLKWWFQRW